MCNECHALSSLDCPDCAGSGRIRQIVHSAWDAVPVQQVKPCLSCSTTGKVYCSACLGIGCMRCPDCRGLGHIKCNCGVASAYARENL